MSKPHDEKTGIASFDSLYDKNISLSNRIAKKIANSLLYPINKTLQFFRLGGIIWK
jgi:hypothetical protein